MGAYRGSIRRALLRLARSPAGSHLVGYFFTHMTFLFPLDRLRETETLVAFHHHILLVPRRRIQGLDDLSSADTDFMVDLFETVQSLVREFDLETLGYRLIANGGPYQDVPHLHLHLVSGSPNY